MQRKRRIELAIAIIDCLKECKFATCWQIADKLKETRGAVSPVLRELRRTNPHISAVAGKWYMWLETPATDMGLRSSTAILLESEYKFIKEHGCTSVLELSKEFNRGDTLIMNDLRTIYYLHKDIKVERGRKGRIYCDKNMQSNMDLSRDKVLGLLSIDSAIDFPAMCSETGNCSAYLRSVCKGLEDDGLIQFTTQRHVLLKSDCPASKLTDSQVKLWFNLRDVHSVNHGVLHKWSGLSNAAFYRAMKSLVEKCPYIREHWDGSYKSYEFDEDAFKKVGE